MRKLLLLLLLLYIPSAIPQASECYLTGCAVGATITVIGGPANVRQAPGTGGIGGTVLGTQLGGAAGIIRSAPLVSNGAWLWQLVQFGATPCSPTTLTANCGYMGNDNLQLVSAPPPPACTPPTFTLQVSAGGVTKTLTCTSVNGAYTCQ